MRTIVEIPDNDLKLLKEICERGKVSRAEIVRRALKEFLQRIKEAEDIDTFGIWREAAPKRGLLDSLQYEDKLRSEWERE